MNIFVDLIIVLVLVPAFSVTAYLVGITVVEMFKPMPPSPPNDMGPL